MAQVWPTAVACSCNSANLKYTPIVSFCIASTLSACVYLIRSKCPGIFSSVVSFKRDFIVYLNHMTS